MKGDSDENLLAEFVSVRERYEHLGTAAHIIAEALDRRSAKEDGE